MSNASSNVPYLLEHLIPSNIPPRFVLLVALITRANASSRYRLFFIYEFTRACGQVELDRVSTSPLRSLASFFEQTTTKPKWRAHRTNYTQALFQRYEVRPFKLGLGWSNRRSSSTQGRKLNFSAQLVMNLYFVQALLKVSSYIIQIWHWSTYIFTPFYEFSVIVKPYLWDSSDQFWWFFFCS